VAYLCASFRRIAWSIIVIPTQRSPEAAMNAHDNTESNERRAETDAISANATSEDIRPRTRLGAQLLELRRAGIAAGIPLLSWEEIEEEREEQRRTFP